MRKFPIALLVIAAVVALTLSGGVWFATQKAETFVAGEVAKERDAKCAALRAEYANRWNQAVDSGQIDRLEGALADTKARIDARCPPD